MWMCVCTQVTAEMCFCVWTLVSADASNSWVRCLCAVTASLTRPECLPSCAANNNIGEKGMAAIAATLGHNVVIKSLDLEDNPATGANVNYYCLGKGCHRSQQHVASIMLSRAPSLTCARCTTRCARPRCSAPQAGTTTRASRSSWPWTARRSATRTCKARVGRHLRRTRTRPLAPAGSSLSSEAPPYAARRLLRCRRREDGRSLERRFLTRRG
jgi:hypothetical protein